MSLNPAFNDSWIGYFFIPFAAIFVYYLGADVPFYKDSFTLNDLIYILLNVALGLIVWRLIRKIFFSVIKDELSLKLFFKAFVLNLIAGLILLVTLRLIHDLIFNKSTGIEYYTLELPADALFILIINLFYLILFYKNKTEQIETANVSQLASSNKISIQSAKKSFLLNQTDIAFVELENKITSIYLFSGEKIVTVYSLNQLYEKLPKNIFFQANRQLLLNREVIRSFEVTETRKLKIQLSDSIQFNKEIFISKAKSSSFKNWFLDKE